MGMDPAYPAVPITQCDAHTCVTTAGSGEPHELPGRFSTAPKAAQQIAMIGELKLEKGQLTIRKEIRRILKGIGVWRRFR